VLPSGFEFDTSQLLVNGTISAVLAVPEPGSLPVATMGLLGLLAITRRRRRRRE
jgi:MYXO-CTERM domain-containing protein